MRNLTLALTVFASMAFALPAFADVPPPNSEGCNMKVSGDACQKDDGSNGSCVTDTCSKLDYSTTPPTSVNYECLLCTGAPPADVNPPAPDDDGGCSVKHGAAAGAAGAWAVGAALLLVSRRLRSRSRNRRP